MKNKKITILLSILILFTIGLILYFSFVRKVPPTEIKINDLAQRIVEASKHNDDNYFTSINYNPFTNEIISKHHIDKQREAHIYYIRKNIWCRKYIELFISW
ncbi:hypothetical protein [Mycoplasmopsis cynos]|uniref:hypothetical protein n=1 Tax=Mycoplasmopsis cynos TaxID=171284 RepID=UPI0021FD56DC|nr:hypothetical protein [Mycoplasmopsis cynos]UWV92700.1 hypothetical protein NWE57_01160 [Mycoplasmopsis cynos]WAM04896.1 hypothetical protein ONA01_01665 [Mycoplasmopsis cynos]